MVRKYKKMPGTKVYQNYSQEHLETALRQFKRGQITLRDARELYNIPKSTLQRHAKEKPKKHGGQTILTKAEESRLVHLIVLAGEWGYPLEKITIRYIVKGYLDRKGVRVAKFNNNMPGVDWANLFCARHKEVLTERLCENIKRSRAAVTRETINKYFDNLQTNLQNVEPESIINYDETCFVDDPGRKKVIVKRKTRHPERIIDATKQSTSVMFAVSGDGQLFPPFIVYKSEHLYDTWLTNGPPGARYGRNKSGWFDQPLFEDWFISIALPFLKRRPAPRVIIGDNLCSHLSHRVIELCEENNIRFSFLPPNSTHLTQPLDVSVFGPMKKAWRSTLEGWKKQYKGSLPKEYFPSLLRQAVSKLEATLSQNIKSGFRGTGIIPLDRNQVLKRLPPKRNLEEDDPNGWTESVLEVLNESRNACKPNVARKRKVTVEPGKSISTTDFLEARPQPSTSKTIVPQDSQEDYILELESDKAESEVLAPDEYFDVQHPMENSIAVDDFVEVEFKTNKVEKYFIGQIKGLFGKTFEVKFLRPNRKIKNCFIYPTVEDICMITPEQIVKKLPKPTELRRGGYKFPLQMKLKSYAI